MWMHGHGPNLFFLSKHGRRYHNGSGPGPIKLVRLESSLRIGQVDLVAMTLARVASPIAVKRSPCQRLEPSLLVSQNWSRNVS